MKYLSFFLKTQLFAVLTVAILFVAVSPIILMSMTKSLLPVLLYVPMIGIGITLLRFYDGKEDNYT